MLARMTDTRTWPVPSRRGTGVPAPAEPWRWASLANASAPAGACAPAMLLAREAVDWLAHNELQEMLTPAGNAAVWWSDDEPTPLYGNPDVAELYGFLVVVGVLEANPGWTHLRDDNLVQAAVAWFFGDAGDCPWWAERATAAAGDGPAAVRAEWSPWWRSASIWPKREDVALAAVACEHLARRYDKVGTTPTAAAALWLPAPCERVLPWRLVDALADVLGPQRKGWPWPYDSWPLGPVGAIDPGPESMWARDEHP